MLSFLFLRYLSDHYEAAAKKELDSDYPEQTDGAASTPLQRCYQSNLGDVAEFEMQMRRKVHDVIEPQHLWSSIAKSTPNFNLPTLWTAQIWQVQCKQDGPESEKAVIAVSEVESPGVYECH